MMQVRVLTESLPWRGAVQQRLKQGLNDAK